MERKLKNLLKVENELFEKREMMIAEEFLESIGVWTKRSSSEVLPSLLPQILSNYNLKVNKYFTAGSLYLIVSCRVRIVVMGIYRILRTRIDIFVKPNAFTKYPFCQCYFIYCSESSAHSSSGFSETQGLRQPLLHSKRGEIHHS